MAKKSKNQVSTEEISKTSTEATQIPQTQNQPNQKQQQQPYIQQQQYPQQFMNHQTQPYVNNHNAFGQQPLPQYYQQNQHFQKQQQVEYIDAEFLDLTLAELLRYYFYFVVLFFFLVGSYEEIMSKGSHLNGSIRHYFGMQFFVEYTSQDPLDIFQYEDEVPKCDYELVTPKVFFQEYVSKYRPCLFKGYGKQWPAFHKWQNETYLKEMAADEIIYAEMQKDNRFAYFTEGAKRTYLSYGEFLDKFKEPNRTFHYYYSFEDPPGPLKNDIINPPIMDSLFEYKQVTFWQGYGTLTKPHTDSMENMMCVFEGYKNFTIVAPHERKYVYAGYNGVPDNYSPVEFVKPDYNKWPDFKKAHVRTVHIAPGDCLYLPAYYWHQVGSSPGVSIGIATWYKTHHQSADFIQFAMQKHIV